MFTSDDDENPRFVSIKPRGAIDEAGHTYGISDGGMLILRGVGSDWEYRLEG